MLNAGLIRAVKGASGVATAVVTIYGLYQLITYVNSSTNSQAITVIVTGFLFAICLLPFFYHFSRSSIFAAYGLAKPSTERIVLLQKITLSIRPVSTVGPDVSAELQWHTEFVFFDTPNEGDLVDFYYIDPSLTLEGFRYDSTDAKEVRRKFIGNNRIAVFWRPKNPIVPYTRYVHSEKAIPPMSYAHPAFFQLLKVVFPTGRAEVYVSTCIPIEDAVIYPRPKMRKIAGDLNFMEYSVNYSKSIGEVHLSPDGKQLKAVLETPKAGTEYFCIMFTKGGREYWRSRLSAESKWARLRRKICDINWRL